MIIKIKETPKFLLPEGKHEVTIMQIEEGTSQSGSDFFEPQFENEQGYVKGRLYNTERSLPRIIELFKACNLPTDPNTSLDTTNLIGKRLNIVIDKKERDGKLFLDVVRYENSHTEDEESPDIWSVLSDNPDDLPF